MKPYTNKKAFRTKFGEGDSKPFQTYYPSEDKFNIKSTKISYMYSLVLSLKTYIEFLRSDEEKKMNISYQF